MDNKDKNKKAGFCDLKQITNTSIGGIIKEKKILWKMVEAQEFEAYTTSRACPLRVIIQTLLNSRQGFMSIEGGFPTEEPVIR